MSYSDFVISEDLVLVALGKGLDLIRVNKRLAVNCSDSVMSEGVVLEKALDLPADRRQEWKLGLLSFSYPLQILQALMDLDSRLNLVAERKLDLIPLYC